MEILKAKVYDIHEEDHDIHQLRFHPAKKIMMEIGFVEISFQTQKTPGHPRPNRAEKTH